VTTRDPKGRFIKGQSGNPGGRPALPQGPRRAPTFEVLRDENGEVMYAETLTAALEASSAGLLHPSALTHIARICDKAMRAARAADQSRPGEYGTPRERVPPTPEQQAYYDARSDPRLSGAEWDSWWIASQAFDAIPDWPDPHAGEIPVEFRPPMEYIHRRREKALCSIAAGHPKTWKSAARFLCKRFPFLSPDAWPLKPWRAPTGQQREAWPPP
jgi:hypothetical protein